MKKRILFLLFCLVILAAWDCNKKNDQKEVADGGNWSGFIYVYNTILINRPDGTSRLYLRVPFNDTAAAEGKYDGIYTYTGNKFFAEYSTDNDSAYLVSTHIASGIMTGMMTLKAAPGFSYYFELRK